MTSVYALWWIIRPRKAKRSPNYVRSIEVDKMNLSHVFPKHFLGAQHGHSASHQRLKKMGRKWSLTLCFWLSHGRVRVSHAFNARTEICLTLNSVEGADQWTRTSLLSKARRQREGYFWQREPQTETGMKALRVVQLPRLKTRVGVVRWGGCVLKLKKSSRKWFHHNEAHFYKCNH